jgi:hypothetical protein
VVRKYNAVNRACIPKAAEEVFPEIAVTGLR